MKNFIEDSAEQIMLNSMANVFITEKLDPVGKEDADIDNDGDSDKSDSYLRNRRKAVGAAIAAEKSKRVKKEELEVSLRQKVEGLTEKKLYRAEKATVSDEKDITVEEKPVKNTIIINPDLQEARRGPEDPSKAEKREKAEKSLAALNKRKKALDKYEKETGRRPDISKSPEGKSHKMRHPGSRQEKKKRGEKETELQQHNRRTTRHNERLMKHGPTKKEAERQKGYDAYEKKHKSKYGNRSVWD